MLSGAVLFGVALVGSLCFPELGARAASSTATASEQQEPSDGAFRKQAYAMARRFLDARFSLHFADSHITMSRAALGARVNLDHLAALLEDYSKPSSAMRRLYDHAHPGQALQLPMPMKVDAAIAMPTLKRLKDMVDREPVNARIDPRKRSVIPAEPGRELDLMGTLVELERAMRQGQGSLTAVVHTRAPQRTQNAFDRVQMNVELASFETPYNRSNTAGDRTHNLRVTAKKIDGKVIAPGEVFDFNAVVGDRTRANGYRAATVISGGELTDGMGGGTCQVASTLHAAVLFAGLPILTRTPHSRPSFYIKLGLDAAVAYGSLNFRFKNDREKPIVIDATVNHGVMRVALWGATQDRSVRFVRHIRKAIPFTEEIMTDDTLPSGLRVLRQRGVPGFEVERQRIIKNETSGDETREVDADLYPATTQIWVEGRGPEAGPDYVAPENDSHPEYVADEELEAVRKSGSSAIEVKADPGRYGTYGWTVREGMAPEGRSKG